MLFLMPSISTLAFLIALQAGNTLAALRSYNFTIHTGKRAPGMCDDASFGGKKSI
jgi:hypothetical protein